MKIGLRIKLASMEVVRENNRRRALGLTIRHVLDMASCVSFGIKLLVTVLVTERKSEPS
jgi:hypothetical protein